MIYIIIGGIIYTSIVIFYLLFNYAAHRNDIEIGEEYGLEE